MKNYRFERIFFSDPYYHEDSHEDLMNQPHGYLTNDDVYIIKYIRLAFRY